MSDIDITQDLTGGVDDASLADAASPNAGFDGAPVIPEGTVPVGKELPSSDPAPNTPNLREQLSSAFKGESDKPTEQANAKTADPNTASLTQDESGKWRLPDGTFASTEQVAAFQAAQGQQPLANEPPANTPDHSPLLAGMTPLEQEQFKSLPAETQQLVARTMEGLNAERARYGEYDMLEQQLIGPRREAWQQNGLSAPMALNQLLQLSDFASTQPQDFIMWFAQSQNIDLDKLLDERDANAQNANPQYTALEQRISQLTSQVSHLVQQPQQAAHDQRLQLVRDFQSETDGAGQPKRPYLAEVMPEWSAQIVAVRQANPNMADAEVLQRAYDNACWSNSTVRAKMQEAARAAQAATVAAKKAAGVSVSGAPAGNVAPNPANSNLSVRDEIKAQFASYNA